MGARVKVFDTLTITASSGAIQSLATILGTTDWPTVDDAALKHGIEAIEIADHSTAFKWSHSSTHADTVTQAAYEPLYLEGDGRLITDLYVRASADAAITSVTLKVWYN